MTSYRGRSLLAFGVLLLAVGGCASVQPSTNVGLTSAAASQPTPPSGPATSSRPAPPERSVLPNGVVVIAQEHRTADVVALQLWVRVGGRDEEGNELGLSHYLEHMLFKGTPTRPPGSIDRLVEGLGGTSNAYTWYDYTHYDIVIPAARLKEGVDLLADIAANASFPPDEIESEKKVVFEEMNLLQDDPEKALSRRTYELAYAPHPYGRPILGTQELIGGLTRERLARYYKKYYVPRNFILVVVGAVTPAQVRAVASSTFGRLTGPDEQRPKLTGPPPIDRVRSLEVRRPEQQAYLSLTWPAAPNANEDIYAVDLLSYILGDSPASLLNQHVRDRGLASKIDASYNPWQLAGVMTITARLDAANLDRAEAATLDVIRRVKTEGVTEEERERAIVAAESSYAFAIETAEGRAKSFGEAEATWTLEAELAYLGRLRGITAAQIQAVARKYLGDDNYARLRFVPEGAR